MEIGPEGGHSPENEAQAAGYQLVSLCEAGTENGNGWRGGHYSGPQRIGTMKYKIASNRGDLQNL